MVAPTGRMKSKTLDPTKTFKETDMTMIKLYKFALKQLAAAMTKAAKIKKAEADFLVKASAKAAAEALEAARESQKLNDEAAKISALI